MSTITKYWFLEEFDIFKKLEKKVIIELSETLKMEYINKGDEIKFQYQDNKSTIFFLKTGSVKIVDEQSNTIKYIVKRGNLFRELALYEENNTDTSKEIAYVLEDGVICRISSDHMKKLMNSNNSLNNAVLKLYGLRIKKLERKLENLLFKNSFM